MGYRQSVMKYGVWVGYISTKAGPEHALENSGKAAFMSLP